jgi:hypothetical protein
MEFGKLREFKDFERSKTRARFLNNRWSTRNAQLGGLKAISLPEMKLLERYTNCAPLYASSRQWYRFRNWMDEGIKLARK